ncbi:DUF6382 domain-containing protein [Paenibacillus sp. J22TS3]|uniref:DUF6382 domain-containing protein n=1 Tax=Paenibacillus sp. J22TS3 TaxID=2807192 RepID=UPI001B1A915C|nr:DUF6382 domain-containing protein [Paenibacillus sp. J22TS3]GIP22587.1 hypothetical protein J22TS3_28620 [Paenibacillus sp. J22TS3]
MPVFQTDFVRSGGTYMVLTCKEGMLPGQLNRVQCGMITSASVPHLLKLDIKEIDLTVSLHYDITGKRRLSQCMKSEKISMLELYVLLLQLVNALDECKMYMLQPSNYWLHEDYIFMDGSMGMGKLYFTYLPLKEELAPEPVQSRLLSLITKLITSVSVLEGNGVQQMMQLCGSDLFSFAGFRKLLRELLAGDKSLPAEEVPHMRTNAFAAGAPEFYSDKRSDGGGARDVMHEESGLNSSGRKRIIPSIQSNSRLTSEAAESGYGMEDQDGSIAGGLIPGGPIPSKLRTYCWLGAGLLAALTWKLAYVDSPGPTGLSVSTAITVILAAGAAWLLSRRSPLMKIVGEGGGEQPMDNLSWGQMGLAESNGADDRDNKRDNRSSKWNLEEFLNKSRASKHDASKSEGEWDESKWRWNDNYLTGDAGKESSMKSAPSTSQASPVRSSINLSSSNLLRFPDRQNKLAEGWNSEVPQVLTGGSGGTEVDIRRGQTSSHNSEDHWDVVDFDSLRNEEYLRRDQSPKTEMLTPSRQATVLLSEMGGEANPSRTPYLERIEEGSSAADRIMLTGVNFVIGRSEEVAQYVETTVGTSRAHLELNLLEGRWSMRDLGSRNGTKLNDTLVAPYKEYPLEYGDTFSISTTSFRLCRT